MRCCLFLLALLPGCTAWRGGFLRQPAPEQRSWPRVLHVSTEHGLRAGFAVSSGLAITSLELPSWGLAVVESVPLALGVTDGSKYKPKPPRGSGWTVAGGARGEFFWPDLIDPHAVPSVGDNVLLGGFVLFDDRPTPAEFWSWGSWAVEGCIVEHPGAAKTESPRLWARVPRNDYRGFLGGPAARVGADGKPRVWGVIVSQEEIPSTSGVEKSLLGIAPLPPDQFDWLDKVDGRADSSPSRDKTRLGDSCTPPLKRWATRPVGTTPVHCAIRHRRRDPRGWVIRVPHC